MEPNKISPPGPRAGDAVTDAPTGPETRGSRVPTRPEAFPVATPSSTNLSHE